MTILVLEYVQIIPFIDYNRSITHLYFNNCTQDDGAKQQTLKYNKHLNKEEISNFFLKWILTSTVLIIEKSNVCEAKQKDGQTYKATYTKKTRFT